LQVPPRKDKRISLPATLHPPTSKKEKRASFTPSLLTAAKKDKRASLTPSLLTPGGTSRKDKRISFTPSLAPSFRSFAPPSSPLSPQARSVMFAEETKIRQYEQRYARESGPLDMHMHLAPKSDIARRRSSIIVPRAIERRPDAKLFPSIHVPGLPLGLSLEQLLRGAIHKIIPGMIVDAYPSKVSHSNDPFARLSFEKNQEVQIKVADIKAEVSTDEIVRQYQHLTYGSLQNTLRPRRNLWPATGSSSRTTGGRASGGGSTSRGARLRASRRG